MVILVATLLMIGVAFGQSPITQTGTACGTFIIPGDQCGAVGSDGYWNFNVTFTVKETDVRLQYAVINNTEKWGIYGNGATCVSDLTTGGCGTFSALSNPCAFANCDASLGQVCEAIDLTGTVDEVRTYRFGIRKNNNGASCDATVVVFIGRKSGSALATCDSPLNLDSGCAGGEVIGSQGPVVWAAAARIELQLVLLALLCILTLLEM